jgi:RNA polymerase sporulation-specific sigma factor
LGKKLPIDLEKQSPEEGSIPCQGPVGNVSFSAPNCARTFNDIMIAETTFLNENVLSDLIVKARGGDEAAFARVIDQVRPFIHTIARRYSKRAGGAPVEDLVQTGLLAAVRSVPCFNTSAGVKFVSYAGVAARRAIHRAANTWRQLPQSVAEEADYIGEIPDARGSNQPPVDQDEANIVRNLITAHLGERERNLINQRFGLDGRPARTYAELAATIGTSRQNVQQIVERALRRLRDEMND